VSDKISGHNPIRKTPLIQISGLSKSLHGGGHRVDILNGIDLEIPASQFVAVTGPSGSGKTTLLSLIAGLDAPTSGCIRIDGQDIVRMNEDELADLRARRFGFVFQSFHLIPTLTALENVMLSAELNGNADAAGKSQTLLESVGLGDRMNHYPAQLSGGEQQRLALARAFVNDPDYILADEPTGNLDSKNAERVMDLLVRLHKERGATVVLVTHEPHIARLSQRVLTIEDGRVVADRPNA
jgi:putative ABC transport system ATP-binding protein